MSDGSTPIRELLALAVSGGLEKALGDGGQLGVHSRFDDDTARTLPAPSRAALIEFEGELGDILVAYSPMPDATLRSAIMAAGEEIISRFNAQAKIQPIQLHEFATRDEATEQLEALYHEPSIRIETKAGTIVIVFGSGLVASAERIVEKSGLNELDAATPVDIAKALADRDTSNPEAFTAAFAGSTQLPASQAPVEAVAAGDAQLAALDAVEELAASADNVVHNNDATADVPHAPDASPWSNLLSQVEVTLSAELGRTELALGDVSGLSFDSVLTLDQIIDEPLTVFANGTPFATARLVVVDDEYGIEILEVHRSPVAPGSLGAPASHSR